MFIQSAININKAHSATMIQSSHFLLLIIPGLSRVVRLDLANSRSEGRYTNSSYSSE
jgi:hypothetical protein